MDPLFGISSLCLQGLLSLAPETETFLCVSHVLFIVTLHSYDIIASYLLCVSSDASLVQMPLRRA